MLPLVQSERDVASLVQVVGSFTNYNYFITFTRFLLPVLPPSTENKMIVSDGAREVRSVVLSECRVVVKRDFVQF